MDEQALQRAAAILGWVTVFYKQNPKLPTYIQNGSTIQLQNAELKGDQFSVYDGQTREKLEAALSSYYNATLGSQRLTVQLSSSTQVIVTADSTGARYTVEVEAQQVKVTGKQSTLFRLSF